MDGRTPYGEQSWEEAVRRGEKEGKEAVSGVVRGKRNERIFSPPWLGSNSFLEVHGQR